jgi:MFS transporter, YNFM family, putative membrane transport protein
VTAGSAPLRPLLLLAGAGFVSGASMRIAEPLLPVLAHDFGGSVRHAAIVLAAFTFAYGAFQIVHGPLGDRVGKLRLVTVALGFAAVASFVCAFAGSLELLAVARLVTGMFSGAVIPLSLAWIGDRVPYENRQALLGRFIAGTLLGQSFGPLLGGVLSDLFGWRATFIAMALAFLAICALLVPEARASGRPPKIDRPSPWRQYWQILRSRRAQPVLVTVGIEGFLFFGAFGFVGAYLHETFELSFSLTGLLVAGFGVGGVVYSFLVRRLVSHLGETGLVRSGGIALLACFAGIAWAPAWTIAAPFIIALGFGFYMLHNTLQTRATEMAPDARGAGVSFFAFSMFLGQAAGVSCFGWLVERFGYAWPFAAAGLLLLVLSLWFRRRLRMAKAAA